MSNGKVLIVDDDVALPRVMSRVLGMHDYEVAIAVDAISAVSTAVREQPDLVLLDMGLPAGNGAIVLGRLRNLPVTAGVPVVVITGGVVDANMRMTLNELGCDEILQKPVSSNDLLGAVRRAMSGLSSDDPLLAGQ